MEKLLIGDYECIIEEHETYYTVKYHLPLTTAPNVTYIISDGIIVKYVPANESVYEVLKHIQSMEDFVRSFNSSNNRTLFFDVRGKRTDVQPIDVDFLLHDAIFIGFNDYDMRIESTIDEGLPLYYDPYWSLVIVPHRNDKMYVYVPSNGRLVELNVDVNNEKDFRKTMRRIASDWTMQEDMRMTEYEMSEGLIKRLTSTGKSTNRWRVREAPQMSTDELKNVVRKIVLKQRIELPRLSYDPKRSTISGPYGTITCDRDVIPENLLSTIVEYAANGTGLLRKVFLKDEEYYLDGALKAIQWNLPSITIEDTRCKKSYSIRPFTASSKIIRSKNKMYIIGGETERGKTRGTIMFTMFHDKHDDRTITLQFVWCTPQQLEKILNTLDIMSTDDVIGALLPEWVRKKDVKNIRITLDSNGHMTVRIRYENEYKEFELEEDLQNVLLDDEVRFYNVPYVEGIFALQVSRDYNGEDVLGTKTIEEVKTNNNVVISPVLTPLVAPRRDANIKIISGSPVREYYYDAFVENTIMYMYERGKYFVLSHGGDKYSLYGMTPRGPKRINVESEVIQTVLLGAKNDDDVENILTIT